MGLLSDQALMLDRHRYRDRHLLLTMLTPGTGLTRGVLRRARGGKAPQSAATEILSLVRATWFIGRHAELATVRHVDLERSSYPLAGRLEAAAAAAVIAELLLTFCPAGEPAPRRFRLGVALLDALLAGTDPAIAIAYGQYWSLVLGGLYSAAEIDHLDPQDLGFLDSCRRAPATALAARPSEDLTRWLDQRLRSEAERPLRALDFFRKLAGRASA